MQVLTMLAARPGCGRITVLVNLASGLVRQGKRVLILQLGPCQRLLDWLGVADDAGNVGDAFNADNVSNAGDTDNVSNAFNADNVSDGGDRSLPDAALAGRTPMVDLKGDSEGAAETDSEMAAGATADYSPADWIRPARYGLDLLILPGSPAERGYGFGDGLLPALTRRGYDYLIINPAAVETHAGAFIPPYARLLVCTDLRGRNEAAEIEALLRRPQLQTDSSRTGPPSNDGGEARPEISLIISNRINPKEWKYNQQKLDELGEYFGYELLADPLPT